jgi:predicted O-linked N-acetylglucosamine transferase (SPINDLY family)
MQKPTDSFKPNAVAETVDKFQQAFQLHQQGQLEHAEALYAELLKEQPHHIDALHFSGVLANQLGHAQRAVDLISLALKINPNNAAAHSNLGLALYALKHFDEALASYNSALALKPNNVETHYNCGNVLLALNRFNEALISYNHVLAIKPDHADAHWGASWCYLSLGDFDNGWKEYEWRWQTDDFKNYVRHFSKPQWFGEESLRGKTILLHNNEQGLGDTLQFCRYAKQVADLGAQVILEVPKTLLALLAKLEGVSQLIAQGSTLPAFDFHCPLLSLPLAFKTRLDSIPANIPYLFSEPDKVKQWQTVLGEKIKPRIGLVWSGNAAQKNDHNRSLALHKLLPLLTPDYQFISLQKELRDTDRELLMQQPLLQYYGEQINDFTDTAALCELMDVVISVCTSVAHLAAAMGKPTWILLSYSPDWRWLMDRCDSPWYPTVRLFRQNQRGDWQGVIERLQHELITLPAIETAQQSQPAQSNIDLFPQAFSLHQQGQLAQAEQLYEQLLKEQPHHIDALHFSGVLANQLGHAQRAVDLISRAVDINPNNAAAHSNLGLALHALKRFDEALTSYDCALAIKPNNAEAYYNRGNALLALKCFDEALDSYERALAIHPNYIEVLCNCGIVLRNLNRLDEARTNYDRMLAIQPNSAEAEHGYGVILQDLKCYNEAVIHYDRALAIKPDLEFILGTRLHLKLNMCAWNDFDYYLDKLEKSIEQDEKVVIPFSALAMFASADIQQKAACCHAKAKYPSHFLLPPLVKHAHSKIKLGYFSSDFRHHPVAYLAAELFERHDRSQFEVIAFSLHVANHKDDMRLRLEAGFDQFMDVSEQSDEQIVRLARELEIDIAVDLTGCTEGGRTGIFAMRVAPIQVNYLGYSGTMGAEYMDYLLADSVIIPSQYQPYYTEKIAYLPNSYMVNDSTRVISNRQFSRAECGLPEQGFVFCCFNNVYKITPEVFAIWMHILQQIEGSVLWLSEGSAEVVSNLQREAQARGIAANRLIFAPRLLLVADHLARQRVADLFLDTLPYNAHTTTSDALWAGLPVLTRVGAAYASRVAASLLSAVGLPELITSNAEDYQALAIQLASHPEQLAAIRQKLADNRLTYPLFDTALFTQHIESAYQAMMERYQAGLAPDYIYVKPAEDIKTSVVLQRSSPHEVTQKTAFYAPTPPILLHTIQANEVITPVVIESDAIEALINQGNDLEDLNQLEEALAYYDRALFINPNYARAHSNRGNVLQTLKRFDDAIASYNQALIIKPEYPEAFYNCGNALQALSRFDEALTNYDKALAIKPDFLLALIARGHLLQNLNRYQEMLDNCDQLLAISPDSVETLINRGNVLQILNRFDDALSSYERALAIKPDHQFLLGTWLHNKMRICDWSDFDTNLEQLTQKITLGEKVSTPFPVLALSSSAALQQKVARYYVQEKYPSHFLLPPLVKHSHSKIKIAYFSADFRIHVTTQLIAELFDRHDRSRFEIIAFSFHSASHKDDMRLRLEATFDQFIDVSQQSDEQVVRLARELEIDIAVDLKGFTEECRTNIFAMRAAPIQVSYLGYPSTMGADYMDYLLADSVLIPPEYQPYYTEFCVYLPNSYQINDTSRLIANKTFTRSELGLPEQGFVFCCFNNNYKITPAVFDNWMQILHQVEGSVLWLLEDNAVAAKNLRLAATARGIDAKRLIFAQRLALPEHLARHRLADLFLDTLPCNAHTTTSDALWAGLPVLTCMGEAFASRVAASLLNAVGLPELITTSAEDYQALAIQLASHPEQLAAIRQKLVDNRLTYPLFDTKLFTQHIESAYQAMMERYQAGLAPNHIYVQAQDNVNQLPEVLPVEINADTFQQALNLHQQGQLEQAEILYKALLKVQPQHIDTLHFSGVLANQRGQSQHAVALISRALAINPDNAAAHSNLGLALHTLKRFDEALASYDRALTIKPNNAEAYYNRGNALLALNHLDEAIISFDHALSIKPDYAVALSNRGNALKALKRYDEALASYQRALAIRPDYAEAELGCGDILQDLKHFNEAIAHYNHALAIKPDMDFILGTRLYMKMNICAWDNVDDELSELAKGIEEGKKVSMPFTLQAVSSSAVLQKKAAEIYTKERHPSDFLLPPLVKHAHSKIKIAYFSADFCHHAVAYLMAELFERHDRSQFEVIAFSLNSASHKDDMRLKLEAIFDQFIDVSQHGDKQVVQLARELGCDIAIDLNGLTGGCRPDIFAMRAAPIQVSYLGYLGTLGADYIDYLLADLTLIPVEHQAYYNEKIAYLPNSFQVSDSTLPIADKAVTRSELGLPAQGFVFCCFNNHYKITPTIFSGWMRLLHHVEGSILWLLGGNVVAETNLRLAATARGIAAERLVFSKRVPMPDYLAQHRVADLFLDTAPYNAGATANAALWAGLPILTYLGDTFSGRMAASLLHAIGLSELVTNSPEDYEALAIQLATHPEQLAAIRKKLADNRLTYPLFNTKLFTQHIESAYQAMMERYQAGLAPDYIYVQARDQSNQFIAQPIEEGNSFSNADVKTSPVASFQQAVQLHQQGQLEQAEALYKAILQAQPQQADALHLLGVIAKQRGQAQLAVDLINQSLQINPNNAAAYSNIGLAFQSLKRFDEALASYERALTITPDYAEALFNQGMVLQNLERLNEAVASYDRALIIQPNYAETSFNRGVALQGLKHLDEALASYDCALAIQADYAEALFNRGNVLATLKRFEEAIASYQRALTIKPDLELLYGTWLHTKMNVCDWREFEQNVNQLNKEIALGKKVCTPFVLQAISSSAALLKKVASSHTNANYPDALLLPPLKKHAHSKIKIAYFSSDFRNHPVAHLTAELFERHDRSRFEIIAFSFHAATHKDDIRLRLETVFDQFIDVSQQSDEQVVRLARELEIDIAVDLNGLTEGSKTNIFAMRAAPIQVTYLGHLGTMGADYIDYLLADNTLIPVEHQVHYAEKIAYLPHSYQVNNTNRPIANRQFTRVELGLPTQGFVFCCFNANFKITPVVFDSWMRLLHQVEGSVLWLLEENTVAAKNLRREAIARGINAERLVFAKRAPVAEHLARHRVADLFLDTTPCNAGATASDALWAGLPLLTYLGDTFSGRMAASLLYAIGLPELVTKTPAEYEALAVQLATHPEQLRALKQKLADNRLTYPLFNTALFTQHIESAYQAMFDRYQAGLAPDYIYVQPSETCEVFKTSQVLSDDSTVVEAVEALINQGNELEDLNQLDQALASYDKALSINPNYARAHSNRGNVLQSLKRFAEALASYQRAIAIRPDYAEAFYNSGNALLALGRLDEALVSYDRALAIKPDLVIAMIGRGTVLQALKRFDEALANYDRVLAIHPNYAEVRYNRGKTLQDLKRFEEALTSYDDALAIKPDYVEALIERSAVLQNLKRFDDALASHDRVLAIAPNYAEVYASRGILLQMANRFDEALTSCEQALALKPDMEFMFGTWLHLKMKIGDWRDFDINFNQLVQKITQGEKVCTPFAVQALSNSAALQKKAADCYMQKYPANFLLPPLKKHAHSKIKIAYFSSDFRRHPVAHLTAELFERHDRSRFEVIAFSFHAASHKDDMRLRLEAAFDQFIDVSQQTDEQVARLARELEIDIAIDLNGLTEGSRTHIFAMRAAPIQVSYLGYLGTMGADYMDYLLADSTLIPVEHQAYYTEKIAYLPQSFQVNDSKLLIATKTFTRAELGLPAQGFVFCCFNASFKITPVVFDSWMRLLHQVKGSVLWLLEENNVIANNLRREAITRGIDAERLVFANRLPVAEHLARHRVADLFLDTSPCNAGATASDALWAGLPLLTCLGDTFSGRMAASLLYAIGLPELVTKTPAEYEALAIQLATHPEQLRALKQKLADNRLTYPLFNTALLTQHIESAYQAMFDRHQAGLAPDYIYVKTSDVLPVGAKKPPKQSLFDKIAQKPAQLFAGIIGFSSRKNKTDTSAQVDRAKFEQAQQFHQRGQLEVAAVLYEEFLKIQPDHAEALRCLATIKKQREKTKNTVDLISQVPKTDTNNVQVHWNKAPQLPDSHHLKENLTSVVINPATDAVEALINQGNELEDLNRLDEALASYDRALSLNPDYARAHSNRGNVLQLLKRFDDAIICYDRALAIRPDYAEAFFNRGNALQKLSRFDDALASYDRALAIKPNFLAPLIARGAALQDLKRFNEAILSYDHALDIDPNHEFLFGDWLYTKMNICDWRDFEHTVNQLQQKIAHGEKALSPFAILAMSSSAALQKRVAEIYIEAKHPNAFLLPALTKHTHSKIRIAYFSADFYDHATAHLMAELFERHDKSRFEVIAFSFNPQNATDKIRSRLEAAFDQFIDVNQQSDEQVVRLARELEIDIAIDLKGFTQYARVNLFAMRVAPIQVNYLGYPGTMGADYIDYLVADSVLIPTEYQAYYSEKIATLPNSYQVNDSTRPIANRQFTRAELGLPEQGFVFCCFNNNYKITPAVFDSWMRLLQQIEGSVLWLLSDNEAAESNLRQAATARGIAADRLVFAQRLKLPEHLARHRVADLFLDTVPCNAHTTASDALWAGLPVLTCVGEVFASRVAASLLTAVGLPELITSNLEDYEALAIQLASHPEQLKAIKQRLVDNRLTHPLFNTTLFTQHIESAYQAMFDRYQADLVPEHIYVKTSEVFIDSEAIEALINQGNELEDLNRLDEALASYDRALSLNPDYARAHSNRGNVLQLLERFDDALASYDHALAIRPDYAEAFFNRGNALQALRRFDDALASYDNALAIKPEFVIAIIARGAVLQDLKRFDDALASYDRALAIQPAYAEALYNRGIVLQLLNRFDEALSSYEQALAIQPDMDFMFGTWLSLKMKLCDWRDFETNLNKLSEKIIRGEKACNPFTALVHSSSAALQEKAARCYAETQHPSAFALPPLVKHAHQKIKIGYFSADFRNHPVAHLAAKLFESHDRSRFEVIAFSFHQTNHKDDMRLRLEAAFDQFIDVSQQSDEQVLRLARELEIDIAIDLNGFTEGCRANIFAMRAAPIQASYLGYLGTMGADYMDYLLADSTLIPVEHQTYYREKITYLPYSFQVNDNNLAITNKHFTRAELGLPEQGFVFCCFNNSFKITPAVFDSWMRLLHHIKGSVLWLLEDNVIAAKNLRLIATTRGIDANRLVFAQRLPRHEHLARYQLADLFLDTSPCNAGATASDGLWEGLPLLTCLGKTFAGRMAASLLNAIGLPELITNTLEDYEALAVQLATHPQQLADIKHKLAANRLTYPLFDTVLFTQHIESAYQTMFDRYQANLAPAPIYVQTSEVFKTSQVLPTAYFTEIQQQSDASQTNTAEFLQAFELHQQGNTTQAEVLYKATLQAQPQHSDALHLLGVLNCQRGQAQLAVDLISQSLHINPNNADAHSNLGLAFQALNRFDEALASYERALSIQPNHVEALFNRGMVLLSLQRFEEAVASYDHALRIQPNYVEAFCNRGVALQKQKRLDDALASYDRALTIRPDYAEVLTNRGNVLRELKRLNEAVSSYDHALSIATNDLETLTNRGNALAELKRYDDALASYDRALAIAPDYVEALCYRGVVLQDLNRWDDALESYDRALVIRPDYSEALCYRGLALQELKRWDEALASYQRALTINPDHEFLFGSYWSLKMKLCDWRDFDHTVNQLQQKIAHGEKALSPFAILAMSSSAALQKRVAEIYIEAKHPDAFLLPALTKHSHSKIRIAYFSADFYDHATAHLMAELFERHDKSRFELLAFSFNPQNATDKTRSRLEAAFDQFIDVNQQSDEQVVRLARELEIDIAIDLKGFTQYARLNLFAMRVAPIQVNYLGYPGTMGADYIDYLVADSVLIPTEYQAYYAEKIAYLPNSYQVNDSTRLIAEKQFTRTELGLPEQGFVFCCFNNNYKITPAVFDSWMRLLQQIEGSVLWLLSDNEAAESNLRQAATARGIAADRLVFAQRLKLPEHLARHRLADLFLDTLPCNAHTTASDALWAGLPVLTCVGEVFASRVAASLLTAVGLPELITSNLEDYEALAIQLASHPEQLKAIKQRLVDNRLTHPLFNTTLFTQHIESAYQAMFDRYQADLAPAHIYVKTSEVLKTSQVLNHDNADKFAQAMNFHQQGQLAAAEALYEDILKTEPQHVDALHFLGVLKTQQGQPQCGVELIKQSIQQYPNNAAAHSNLGVALYELNRFDEVLMSYEQVLTLTPDNVEILTVQGNLLLMLNRPTEALASYDKALAIEPNAVEIRLSRGTALQALNRFAEALIDYDHILASNANHAEAWFGRALLKNTETEACYRRAIAIKPDYVNAHCNLITLLKDQGRSVEAKASLDTALAAIPDNLELRMLQLIMTLAIVWKTTTESDLALEQFDNTLTELANWLASSPSHSESLHNASLLPLPFLLAYRVGNHLQRLSRYGDLMTVPSKFMATKTARKKLKMVVVSHHFHHHSVWNVITRGLLVNLDRTRFELVLYHLGNIEDQETAFAKSLADEWRDTHSMIDLSDWLAALNNNAPDVIFYPEIGMDPMSARLAAHRIAPLQIASWGHPITTGLPTIDMYFSGELLESPVADNHYRERLIRLPSTGCCTTLFSVTPEPLPELKAQLATRQGITFVIAQTPYKFDPADDALYADIASAVGDSTFILLRASDNAWAMDQIIARLEKTFVERGLNPQQHLLVIPWLTVEKFQSLLELSDIYLDCPSFSGYTTAWQAVHRGIPIVTLEGEFMRQRLAAGLLRKIGITDTIARSRDEYVQLAVKLAKECANPKSRAARRLALKTAAPKADNDVSVVRAFEQSVINALAERGG